MLNNFTSGALKLNTDIDINLNDSIYTPLKNGNLMLMNSQNKKSINVQTESAKSASNNINTTRSIFEKVPLSSNILAVSSTNAATKELELSIITMQVTPAITTTIKSTETLPSTFLTTLSRASTEPESTVLTTTTTISQIEAKITPSSELKTTETESLTTYATIISSSTESVVRTSIASNLMENASSAISNDGTTTTTQSLKDTEQKSSTKLYEKRKTLNFKNSKRFEAVLNNILKHSKENQI